MFLEAAFAMLWSKRQHLDVQAYVALEGGHPEKALIAMLGEL